MSRHNSSETRVKPIALFNFSNNGPKFNRILFCLILLSASPGWIATVTGSEAGELRLVAQTGDLRPDGERFNALALPSIDDAGRAAFRADSGAFAEAEGGGLRLIAYRADAAPGVAGGAIFERFLGLTVSKAGSNAFFAELAGPGIDESNGQGMWLENGSGDLRLVAQAGGVAPGTGAGVYYTPFVDFYYGTTFPRLTLGGGGHVSFLAGLTGPGVIDQYDRGLFVGTGDGVRLLARRGQVAPGAESGALFSTFLTLSSYYPFSINDNGETAFVASLQGPSINQFNDRGIWTDIGQNGLTLVARTDQAAPGSPANGERILSLTQPRINNAGQLAFMGTVDSNGPGQIGDTVIWAGRPGELVEVARDGLPAPGVSDGSHFTRLWTFDDVGPVINRLGQVAFVGQLAGPLVDELNDTGIWSQGIDGQLKLVAREGSPAPGGGAFTHFDAFGARYALNGMGQLAFRSAVLLPDDTLRAASGIWAQDRSGQLKLIVRSGESQLSPITGISVGHTSGNQDGWPRWFNDRGEIVFHAQMQNYRTAIYVSTLVAVPEPTAATAASIGLLSLVALCRRRGGRF